MTQASKALQALAAVAVLVAAAALLNPSAERHRSQIQKTLAERSPLAGALGLGALAAFVSNYHSLGVASYTSIRGAPCRWVSWAWCSCSIRTRTCEPGSAALSFPTPFRSYCMGNRLTEIATRTGDAGTTGLGNNQRVSKNSLRIHAMGDVDELNSHIGLLLCEPLPDAVRELLVQVQHQLFNLGGELSIPGFELLKKDAVLQLDEALDEHNAALPRLQEFILPAGTRAAAQAHVCRTVARRAERAVVALGNEEALNDAPRQYLNRLSDLMFVLARVLNRMNGGDDVYWKSERLARQEASE